ncbi:hypothetical protein TTHERM_00824070, partial (macronuclear) [Tetrahymena thermophila SB210]
FFKYQKYQNKRVFKYSNCKNIIKLLKHRLINYKLINTKKYKLKQNIQKVSIMETNTRQRCESVEDYTQNGYILNGCEVIGHENQQLQFIFLRQKNDKDSLFGCSYCIAERQYKGCKVISLIQALKVQHRQSLFRFPELNQKIEQDVLKAIQTTNSLEFDQEIERIFDSLSDRLKEEVKAIEEQAKQLIQDIREKGDEMKDSFTTITNCDKIRKCFESDTDYDNLLTNFNTIIQNIYSQLPQNNQEIKQKTQQYIDKLNTFKMEFSANLSKKILEAIKKISFVRQENIKMEQSQSSAITVQKEIYLKQENLSQNYGEDIIQLSQQELGGNLKKFYQPFKINQKRDNLQTLVIDDTKAKKMINQVYSDILDNQKTYRIFFKVNNYSKNSVFSIGLADISKNTEPLISNTKIAKVFNPKSQYEGLTFVEYGADISDCYGENKVFVFKFNISKNYAKIQTEDKSSSNTFENNIIFDQSIQYCFFIVNSTPSIEFEIVKVESKKN